MSGSRVCKGEDASSVCHTNLFSRLFRAYSGYSGSSPASGERQASPLGIAHEEGQEDEEKEEEEEEDVCVCVCLCDLYSFYRFLQKDGAIAMTLFLLMRD